MAVRVVVVVGNVVVVADTGTYLVSIFVTLTCIIFLVVAPLHWSVNDVQ